MHKSQRIHIQRLLAVARIKLMFGNTLAPWCSANSLDVLNQAYKLVEIPNPQGRIASKQRKPTCCFKL